MTSAKMRGYLKILKTHKFAFYVAAYLDITEELSLLSRSFQDDDQPISVRANAEVAAISLRVQLAYPGLHVHKIPQDPLEGTSDDDISRFNQDSNVWLIKYCSNCNDKNSLFYNNHNCY